VSRGLEPFPYFTVTPTPTKYASLPGTAGAYFSTPDSAAASITGDIDIRVNVALDDWTPATIQVLVSKVSVAQAGYCFSVDAAGVLGFRINTAGALDGGSSTAVPGFADGTAHWVRVTKSVATGTVTYYTSDDGVTWAQLGLARAGAVTPFTDNTLDLDVGRNGYNAAQVCAGRVHRAEIFNGINGAKVVNLDPNDHVSGSTWPASGTNEVWTINGTASVTATSTQPAGLVKVIGTTAVEALPAGTIKKDGLAYHPDGSLYVIFG
jgi:hypothetical protein